MPNSINPYKKAISHATLFGLANIIRKITGFLMLPLYTRYLSPEDYGVVEMLMVVIIVMEVFLGMKMGEAVFRYYFLANGKSEQKTKCRRHI